MKASQTLPAKCKRAFERRFGQSLTPLGVTPLKLPSGSRGLLVIDLESGSWAEYDVSAWRIRMVREHDAAAN